MNTGQLISLLAAQATPIDVEAVDRRFRAWLVAAVAGTLALLLLTLGTRADLALAASQGMFWLKLLFPAAMAGAAAVLLHRIGRPGAPLGTAPAWAALPALAVGALAARALLAAPPGGRLAQVVGTTGLACTSMVVLLGTPAAVFAFLAVRGLAPLRTGLAGALAGLFGGAVGAAVYALHCVEMQAPFVAAWYLLGMVIPAAAGAWLGPRLLRG